MKKEISEMPLLGYYKNKHSSHYLELCVYRTKQIIILNAIKLGL